jgi:hypothetical protein
MGCACVKSDVVVKNQKVTKNLGEIQVPSSKESRSVKEDSSNRLNNRNREVNSNNNMQGLNQVNQQSQVQNSNNVNSRGGLTNSQPLSQQNVSNVAIRQQASNNQQRHSSTQAAYNRMFENIRSDINPSNIVAGNMPYLASSNDPNYNLPTLGKRKYF